MNENNMDEMNRPKEHNIDPQTAARPSAPQNGQRAVRRTVSRVPRDPRTAADAARPQASGRHAPTSAGNDPALQSAQNRTPRPNAQNRPARQPEAASAEPQTTPAPTALRSRKRHRRRMRTIVFRTLLVIFTVIFILVFALIALCRTLVSGPSETVRDTLVLMATQSSALKWLPGVFLGDELVAEICANSANVQTQVIPMGAFNAGAPEGNDGDETGTAPDDTSGQQDDTTAPSDPWADAIDGMIYKTYNKSTFKAYVLIVKDPSRVYVGTSSDYKSGKIGSRIFEIVEREGAVAGINAGEFSDTNGQGTGDTPIGLTYSKGECVWSDNQKRTFIGFDSDNVLHAVESITKAQADELGIRDAVSFQTGNVLISNDGVNVSLHYAEGNVGMAQRTAIGQRQDGAVILVVTDGRTASSLGATRNDIIDLLVSEGAVVAGMLDGGSSTMMYYENYYEKYDIDTSTLDEYQLQGLTNRYKAFTKPRHMPTYFLVSPKS